MGYLTRKMGVLILLSTMFIALAAFEATSPIRVEIFPSDGGTIGADGPIRLRFSRPVEEEAVTALFRVDPPLAGRFEWQGLEAQFLPDESLTPGATLRVIFQEGLAGGEDIAGSEARLSVRESEVLFLRTDEAPFSQNLYRLDGDGETHPVYESRTGITSFIPTQDGEWIFVASMNERGGSHLIRMNRDGHDRRMLLDCGTSLCRSLAISGNERFLAYEKVSPGGGEDVQVHLLDLLTHREFSPLDAGGIASTAPEWSHDGSRLGLVDLTNSLIWVFDLTTGLQYQLPNEMGEMGTFSPDGQELVYPEIRIVGLSFVPALLRASLSFEGGVETLLEEQEEDIAPAWSPDGELIAFGRKRLDRQGGFVSQLAIANLETGEVTMITSDPDLVSTDFRWSPDGQQLIFTRYRMGGEEPETEIWLYDRHTGETRMILSGGEHARWLP